MGSTSSPTGFGPSRRGNGVPTASPFSRRSRPGSPTSRSADRPSTTWPTAVSAHASSHGSPDSCTTPAAPRPPPVRSSWPSATSRCSTVSRGCWQGGATRSPGRSGRREARRPSWPPPRSRRCSSPPARWVRPCTRRPRRCRARAHRGSRPWQLGRSRRCAPRSRRPLALATAGSRPQGDRGQRSQAPSWETVRAPRRRARGQPLVTATHTRRRHYARYFGAEEDAGDFSTGSADEPTGSPIEQAQPPPEGTASAVPSESSAAVEG